MNALDGRPDGMAPEDTKRFPIWPVAIVIFFVIVFILNGIMIYIAYTNDDPIVESYDTNRR